MNSDALLAQIEESLVAEIPNIVAAAKVREPVYCLRIWYAGTDVDEDDRTPNLMLPKETHRRKMLAEKGDKAPHYIWCGDEFDHPAYAHHISIEHKTIVKLCRDWYLQMPDRGLPDDNDLIPFRQMIQRVSAQLNLLDWRTRASVTDDFVVFPADGSHSFCDDYGDMVASVSNARLELLRSRGLLGKQTWWTLGNPEGND